MNRHAHGAASLRLGALLALVMAVTGCVAGGAMNPFAGTGDGPDPIGSTRLVERDVEAPEIFDATGDGFWDGRPTMGGVWVAHPRARDPERVIIRNAENGRFVIGSLFRRDPDSPGPEMAVSSDAASALNMSAGDEVGLVVTALRREDLGPADPSEDDFDAPPPAQAEITSAPLDAPTAAPATSAAETVVASASPLERPFVQIGIFSVQENANNTGQALRSRGLSPTIYDQTSNNRRFWRVVVGPAQTTAERDRILATVRELGFDDAYFVRR